MPELFIASPAGFIASIGYGSLPYTLDVFRPLPGAKKIYKTTGVELLTGSSGLQGTILAAMTAGSTGMIRAVAFLVDRWPGPTKYIGIALDASNRPYALMSVGGFGAISGQSLPMGDPITVGSPLNLRLAFSAGVQIHNGWYAAFQVEDAMIDVWMKNPDAPWTPFNPAALLIGIPPVGGMSDMNGDLRHVQISNSVEMASRFVPVLEEELLEAVCHVQADSTTALAPTMVYGAAASLVADSSASAEATMVYASDTSIATSSSVAADLTS